MSKLALWMHAFLLWLHAIPAAAQVEVVPQTGFSVSPVCRVGIGQSLLQRYIESQASPPISEDPEDVALQWAEEDAALGAPWAQAGGSGRFAGIEPAVNSGASSDVLHELEVSRASAAIIEEDNKRLREQLVRWHQTAASLAAREARTMQLLQEDGEGAPAEPLLARKQVADPSARTSNATALAENASDAAAARRRTPAAEAVTPLNQTSLKLVKVGTTQEGSSQPVVHLAQGFNTRPVQVLLAITLLALVLIACAMAGTRRAWPNWPKATERGDQGSRARWPCSLWGPWWKLGSTVGSTRQHTRLEIGEIRLGGLSETFTRSGNVRILVQPGGDAAAMRTRYGAPTSLEGEDRSMSFAEVMTVSATGDGPCEFSVFYCDGFNTDRIATVAVAPKELMDNAALSQYFRVDLVREGGRWGRQSEDGRRRPYLTMRLREINPSPERHRSGRNLDRLQRQVSGRMPFHG